MNIILKKKKSFSENDNLILLINKKQNLSKLNFSKKEVRHIESELKNGNEIVTIDQFDRIVSIVAPNKEKNKNQFKENIRLIGDKLQTVFHKKKSVIISCLNKTTDNILLMAEGLALSNYTFTQHKSNPNPHHLTEILLNHVSSEKIHELQNIINGVFLTRDLINQPFSHLTASELANEAKKSAEKNGITVDIFNKKKIQSLKMGGLLAVNKGSIDGSQKMQKIVTLLY